MRASPGPIARAPRGFATPATRSPSAAGSWDGPRCARRAAPHCAYTVRTYVHTRACALTTSTPAPPQPEDEGTGAGSRTAALTIPGSNRRFSHSFDPAPPSHAPRRVGAKVASERAGAARTKGKGKGGRHTPAGARTPEPDFQPPPPRGGPMGARRRARRAEPGGDAPQRRQQRSSTTRHDTYVRPSRPPVCPSAARGGPRALHHPLRVCACAAARVQAAAADAARARTHTRTHASCTVLRRDGATASYQRCGGHASPVARRAQGQQHQQQRPRPRPRPPPRARGRGFRQRSARHAWGLLQIRAAD